MKRTMKNRHVAVGRNHIDMTRFNLHLICSFDDLEGRRALKDIGQNAGVIRIEMCHDNEGHVAIDRNMLEEHLKSLKPAGRRANTHYRKSRRRICRECR